MTTLDSRMAMFEKMDVDGKMNIFQSVAFDAKGLHRMTHYRSIGATSGITKFEEDYLNQMLDAFEHSSDKVSQDFATKQREYLKRLKNDPENAKNIAAHIKRAQDDYETAKKRYEEISSPGFFARNIKGVKKGTDEEIKAAEERMRFYENILNAYKTTTISYDTILKHNGMGDMGE